jgi:tetratricopeptide (TPR) repeat protein
VEGVARLAAFSLVGLCLWLTACAPPTPSPIVTPDLSSWLAAGDAAAADGARTAAVSAYEQAAALAPDAPTPYLRLARLYLDWNRPQEGLAAVAEAAERGAADADVEPLRAALYAAAGDWEETARHAEAALALAPDDAATHALVAQAYLNLGRATEAETAYRAILTADPQSSLAHERLGALLAISEPAGAGGHLEAAGTPLATALLDTLEQSAGSDPAYRLTLIGQTCLDHGVPALAALALAQAATANPEYADAQALWGLALDQMGRTEEALPHLEAAVQAAPDSARARSLLGIHLLSAHEPEAARPHLEAAHEADPQNPAFCLYLAYLYADLGGYEVARVWLEEATRLAPQEPAIWERVARFYAERGLGAQGLRAAHNLVALAPESAKAHDLLGWTLFLTGEVEHAEAELGEALAREPCLATAQYHLGEIYAYRSQSAAARAALTRALDCNTDPTLRAEIEEALLRLDCPAPPAG